MAVATSTAALIGGGLAAGGAVYSAQQQKKAAKRAAGQQARSADEAIAFQQESRDMAREDLAPFREFGEGQISALESMLTPQGQYKYLQSNPLFQMALDRADRTSNNALLSRGMVGDARQQLADNTMLSASPLIGRQMTALQNAISLGGNAASGQSTLTQNAANAITPLITGRGNALAAGTVGAANARSNMISGLTSLAPSMIGGIGDLFGGGAGQTWSSPNAYTGANLVNSPFVDLG